LFRDATTMDVTPIVDAAPDVSTATHAKVVLLHASPNLPAIRWCFAAGTKSDGTDAALLDAPPFPAAPGQARGSGFVLPDIGDLSKVVVPYLIHASKAPGSSKCAEVLGVDAGLIPGGDYQKLAPIAAGTIAGGKTVLLVAMGCLGTTFDQSANAQRCGSDFSPLLGNLVARAFELDHVTHDGQLGVQVAHFSPPLGAITGALTNAPDASPTFVAPIVPTVRYGEVKPTPASAVIVPNFQSTQLRIDVLDPDGGNDPVAVYTFPLPEDAGIANGANTTFALVGDPALDAGDVLRMIAVPNDPVVPHYP
jgi:hypothetical protein